MLAAFLFAPFSAAGEPVRCAECGMKVNPESKFCSRLTREGTTLDFCDIGDMLVHINKKSLPPEAASVKDYKTGEWIRADKAFFVYADKRFKTPMGWGIAAFKNRQDAATFGDPRDIKAMLEAVK